MKNNKKIRTLTAFIFAFILYYIIHEGAHFIYAVNIGTFEKINLMFPGMQIQANTDIMSNIQIGIFCLLGVIATLCVAYVLCILVKRITLIKSNFIRALFYYTTLVFLLNDPLYLSIFYKFFGGGDMNGILLLIPETIASLLFVVIAIVNFVIIIKVIIPEYKKAFQKYNQDNEL